MKRLIRMRVATAAATALVGGLALTACGPADAATSAVASPSSSSVGVAPVAPNASAGVVTPSVAASAAGDGGGDNTGSGSSDAKASSTGGSGTSGSSGGSGSGGGSNSPKPCTEADLHLTAQLVDNPINHMLVTATNTGKERCDADNAPQVGFDGDQSVAQIDKGSTPQAVVSLDPGQSAFASITLSAGDGSGTNGHAVKTLHVFFVDRNNKSVGSGTEVSLPSGTFKDDSAVVTFWQSTQALALSR